MYKQEIEAHKRLRRSAQAMLHEKAENESKVIGEEDDKGSVEEHSSRRGSQSSVSSAKSGKPSARLLEHALSLLVC